MFRKIFPRLAVLFALGVLLTTTALQNSLSVSAAPDGLTINVNDTADLPDTNPGDGVCLSQNSTCTLRAAIMEANKFKGMDVIHLQANTTYTLTRVGQDNKARLGDLDIKESIQLRGNGATIDANGAVTNDRALHFLKTKKQQLSYLENLTVKGGNTTVNGGGILSENFLYARYLNVKNNHAGGQGGGVYNKGLLFMQYATIEFNDCDCASGGGGGIANVGTAVAFNSAINNNNSDVDGGGIWNQGGTFSMALSTVANNLANRHGGGIYNKDKEMQVVSSTIAYNFADADHNDDGDGGGINNVFPGQVTLSHTLLGSNGNVQASLWKWDDCHGALDSLGFNLVYYNNNCVVSLAQNLIGFEPKLGVFGAHGGPTKTIPLNSNSPAIDAGNPSGCSNLGDDFNSDQRGYERIVDGNGDATARCDIGAFEYQANPVADSCTAKPQKPKVDLAANNPALPPTQAFLNFSTDCAETYEVVIRRDGKQGPVADSVQGLVLGGYLTGELPKGHKFYARVTACNVHGCTKSKWKRFSINP